MILDNAVIDVAYVIDDKPEKGFVIVELEEGGMNVPEDEIRARIVGQVYPPKKGDKGLLIRRNKENKIQSFWLGTLLEPAEIENDVDGVQFNSGASKIKLSDNEFLAKTKSGKIQQDNKSTQISQGLTQFDLNNNEVSFSLRDDIDPGKTLGLLDIKKDSAVLFSGGNIEIEAYKRITLKSQTGEIFIHGKTKATKSDKRLTDLYEPISKFFLKSNDITMLSNGSITLGANRLVANIGSAALTGDLPGIGPAESFELNVLKGDISTNVLFGNYEVTNLNQGLTGKIKLHVGSLLSPTTIVNSDVTMSFNKIELRQTNIPLFSESGIVFGKGKAVIDSTQGTDVTSEMNVSVESSKMSVFIKSLLTIVAESIKIEIKATAQMLIQSKLMDIVATLLNMKAQLIKVEAQMLDLKGAKTIDMGPKTVAPTGQGPLCAIMICPWSGQIHNGSIATG